MKIYTEEQLFKYLLQHGMIDLDSFILDIIPIEIPSDEEIEASKFPLNSPEQELYNDGWEEGAKWMRDKIQEGNK
jgi:hypothetical protein